MAKYNIKQLKQLEAELALTMRRHFAEFFSSHDYRNDTAEVVSSNVTSLADVESTYSGKGVYLILTDYRAAENDCSFVIDGMKAIYRGQCSTVKNRLKSHLLNDHYRSAHWAVARPGAAGQ
jgi:hypothetical protein